VKPSDPTSSSSVVDLMPYAAPCAVIVAIIDRWNNEHPPFREMDAAMRALDLLGPLPGSIGDAIRLFTTSDTIAPTQFADAVASLRRIAALDAVTPPRTSRRPPWKRRPQPTPTTTQETLWPT
jgi:hypothetical protein